MADIKVLVANPVRPEFLAAGADGTLQTWDLTSHELRGGCFPALADCSGTSVCPEGTFTALQTGHLQAQHSCSLPRWGQAAGTFPSGVFRLPRHQATHPVPAAAQAVH